MDAEWEIEVTRHGSGNAVVAPEIWYAAIPDPEAARAAVEASAANQVGPLAHDVKRPVRSEDLTAMGVAAGQVWKWRKGAVMGTRSMF